MQKVTTIPVPVSRRRHARGPVLPTPFGPGYAATVAARTRVTCAASIAVAVLFLLVGCGAIRQAEFARVEPTCTQNPEMCVSRCAEPRDSTECYVATVHAAEKMATEGNSRHLPAGSLRTLHGQLALLCKGGLDRACSAEEQLTRSGDGEHPLRTEAPVDPEVARATAAAAREIAQATAEDQRKAAEEQAKVEAEALAVSAAGKQCPLNDADCKARCDRGEAPFCLAWTVRLRNMNPPKLTEARAYLQKACDGGVQGGCRAIGDLDPQIQRAAARVEELWGQVQEVGDDLAVKSHAVDWALRVSPTSQTQVAMGRLRKVAAATVEERYCPLRSEFVAATSMAEFSKRAAEHCAGHAPTSNEGNVLTLQCRAAFATGCPAAQPRRQPPPDDAVNTSPAWRAAQQAGDALATTRHTLRVTVDLNPTTPNIQEAEKYRRYEPTIMARAYCPAKKAFVAQFSAAEFAKRAAAHCQGDPPMTAGLSGAQVPLPSDCRDVFALSCP